MGVKSLWSLLTPVGRPVMLETVEGKSMAIDSSIWIYQFQATMRDKEGRGLVNAHVLGFLRRICKLLFYGIKPVFVFDGGAPALKRMTISERKKKRSGAADSHAKIAEKLLAAQLRKEALNHAQSTSDTSRSKGKGRAPQGPVTIDDNTVYLEDLDGSNPPATPVRNKKKAQDTPVSSTKKSQWHDHDPYRLPDVDLEAAVAKATRTTAPDPRLATEDELRAFIDMMRPEDLDVSSPAFRELPTEVQYEIIGDLRLKSRQTSHMRLETMLRSSRSDLDFSRAQIQNLKQRNALTQQLLETTDSIGKANVTIPIRIASERNREYMLVKNEGEGGGWVLGIRDDGTQDKPIVLDNADEHFNSDQDSDEDDDMEEVTIPQTVTPDPDLREYQRELALGGVERRQAAAASKGRPLAIAPPKKKSPKKQPLFIPEENEDDGAEAVYETDWEDVEDVEMFTAVQASLQDQEADELRQALEESRNANANKQYTSTSGASSSHQRNIHANNSDNNLYIDYTPSRLDTALRFANTSRDTHISPPIIFSRPSLLVESSTNHDLTVLSEEDEDEDMEEVAVPFKSVISSEVQTEAQPKQVDSTQGQMLDSAMESAPPSFKTPNSKASQINAQTRPPSISSNSLLTQRAVSVHSEEQLRETSPVIPDLTSLTTNAQVIEKVHPILNAHVDMEMDSSSSAQAIKSGETSVELDVHKSDPPSTSQRQEPESYIGHGTPAQATSPRPPSLTKESTPESPESSESEDETWSRPPTLKGSAQTQDPATHHDEEWDAAQEMNVHEEAGEFARFAAQVRGRDLDSVRDEIDDEIRQLHQQRKAAMRDSEDVTQTMIAQIMAMLRLFGIPYITAPMEAEAQCATLVDLGLVDGVITDDSDVFLFGAKRVFKNMFNQAKTVECFLLTDLARELGLDRGTLIRLAYLLGSDYVEGLPGVGPVVAMELLSEFPGDDGLHKFKDWWIKVQSGRDKDVDTGSAFKKRFKKRFKDLYLPNDWPNAAVRDAYYHPVVDASEEPFKWGLPDLDGLRNFFLEELSWNAGKVDELLLPVIHRMNKRGQDAAANRQGTLNDFFAVSQGDGTAEPRRREAYSSRRLQALVSAHRKAQKARAEDPEPDESEEEAQPMKKKRKKGPANGGEEGKGGIRGRGTMRGRGKGNGRGAKTQVEPRGEGSAMPPEPKPKRAKSKAKPKGKSTLKKDLDSDSASGDEFVPANAPSAEPVREMALRKRVRPRPAYKGTGRDVDGVEGEAKEAEGDIAVDAVDSGSEGSEYQG